MRMRDAVELRRRVVLVRQQADNCYETAIDAYVQHEMTHVAPARTPAKSAAVMALVDHLRGLRKELTLLHKWTTQSLDLLDRCEATSIRVSALKVTP